MKNLSPMLLFGWLLNIDEKSSGKRQIAGVVALTTLVIVIWRLPHLEPEQQTNIIVWLLLISAALICAAFGMESLINQAGFSFKRKSKQSEESFE